MLNLRQCHLNRLNNSCDWHHKLASIASTRIICNSQLLFRTKDSRSIKILLSNEQITDMHWQFVFFPSLVCVFNRQIGTRKLSLPLFFSNSTLNFLWTYLEAMLLSHSLHALPYQNKFEQVSSDHHQMSLAGRSPQVSSPEWGTPPDLLGEVPYHVTYPMIHLMLPTPPPDRQTHTCENITFPKQTRRGK